MCHVRCTIHLVMKLLGKLAKLCIDNFQAAAVEPARIKWQKLMSNPKLSVEWCKHVNQWPKSQISTTKKIIHVPKKPSSMSIFLIFFHSWAQSFSAIHNHFQTQDIQSMEDKWLCQPQIALARLNVECNRRTVQEDSN